MSNQMLLSKPSLPAQKLKEIFPSVNSTGYYMQVPLPSRTLIDKHSEEAYLTNVKQLEQLIESHDVIYLLTDLKRKQMVPYCPCQTLQ